MVDLIIENKDTDRGGEFDDNQFESTEAERSDRREEKISNYFRLLKSRELLFGNAWPYEIDKELREVRLKNEPDNWGPDTLLYVQLLLSSMLAYIEKNRSHELTSGFEYLSKEIFTALMPAHTIVHAFGADNSAQYTGKLYNRLKQLAKDFRGHINTPEKKFPKEGRGDWNIDLVAWNQLGDSRNHIPLALGQCGCSTNDWRTKMGDVSYSAKGAHLTTATDWSVYYFLPEDFAQLEGDKTEWSDFKYGYFHRAIVIDRLRALRLSDLHGITKSMPIKKHLIDEAYRSSFT
ncbi:MAG: hypothetical protein GX086_05965 [Alcaligenaceae bacterium]|nr:hypothetical protein [Alcaligenaceae bacterium]